MNEQLQIFARASLKAGLSRLTEERQRIFKRMYSSDWARLTPDQLRKAQAESYERSIEETVDNMPTDQLDWAMQQVQNSLEAKEPKP